MVKNMLKIVNVNCERPLDLQPPPPFPEKKPKPIVAQRPHSFLLNIKVNKTIKYLNDYLRFKKFMTYVDFFVNKICFSVDRKYPIFGNVSHSSALVPFLT